MRSLRLWTAALPLAAASLLAVRGASALPLVFVNDTPDAPTVTLTGGPLLFSDNPEDLPGPGIAYRDTIAQPGWFRVFDYHVNISGQDLYVGFALTNLSDRPLTVGIGRHAQVVSGEVPWVGQSTYLAWLRSAGAGEVASRRALPPHGTAVFDQLLPASPPGSLVAEMQYDIWLPPNYLPGTLQVTFFAAPSRVPDLSGLPLLPRVPGEVRATFPHDTVVGIFRLPPRQATAIGLFDVSGPSAGYAAPDDALPGESELGYDAVDRVSVWSKGPYGFDYRIRVLPPPGGPAYSLAVTTSHLTREGLPHAGDGFLVRLDGQTHVVTGVYLPDVAPIGEFHGAATLETTLPGGASAPEYFIFTPLGTQGAKVAAPVDNLNLYGWPTSSPDQPRWLDLPIPDAHQPVDLSLGGPVQEVWGYPVRLRVLAHGRPAATTQGLQPPIAVASSAPAEIPFRVTQGGKVVLQGALHFMDFPPAPQVVGAYGATLFFNGYGLLIFPASISRQAKVSMTYASVYPPLPSGWQLAAPPLLLDAAGAALVHPALLDVDDLSRVDAAVARGWRVRILRLAGGSWMPVPGGSGLTPLDHGNELAYWLPAFGTYAVVYQPDRP